MRTLRAAVALAATLSFAVLTTVPSLSAAEDAETVVISSDGSIQQASAPVLSLPEVRVMAPSARSDAAPRPSAPVGRADGGLRDGVTLPDDLSLNLSGLPGGRESLLCLALNDYFEARGETLEGRVAVAKVVLNRVQDMRFPDTVCGVVFENHRARASSERVCQFSWHCDGVSDRPADTDVWRDSVLIASAVLFGGDAINDPTDGAMWYHANSVNPPWTNRLNPSATIGAHLFYQDPNGTRLDTNQVASMMQRLPPRED